MHVTLGLQVIRAASQSKCYGGIIPRLASKSTSCTLPLVGYAVNRVGQALGQAGRGLLTVKERIKLLEVVGVAPVGVLALIEKVPILLFAEKPEHKFPLRFLLGHQFHALLAELLLQRRHDAWPLCDPPPPRTHGNTADTCRQMIDVCENNFSHADGIVELAKS